MSVLLLTWTVKPTAKIKCKTPAELDFSKRKKEYLRGILYYIVESNFTKIVFCENSNTFLNEYETLKEIANSFDKKLEILTFQWDISLTWLHSYGYWESEILDYAYEHSELLKSEVSFYKISGRYIVSNINAIIKDLSNYANYFHRPWLMWPLFSIATSFFKISRENYSLFLYKKLRDFHIKNNSDLALEKIWYLLLYKDVLFQVKFPKIGFVTYSYPSFENNYWILNCRIIKHGLYFIYHKLGLDVYRGFFPLLHKSLFNKWRLKLEKHWFSDSVNNIF